MTRLILLVIAGALACGQPRFQAGAARREITPREPVPMWGYGDRHDALSTGVLDPLYADALVIECGGRKLAIVGLDLGRSPDERRLQAIRKRIRDESGIEYSILAGSHTHHGPVLELSDEAGKGHGKFDAAVRYYAELENAIASAVGEANRRLAPARLAAGSVELAGFNRNRHSRLPDPPGDRELTVLRIDDIAGKPVALLVNFSAHPTMLPSSQRQFSADWVGAMKNRAARDTGAAVIFLQGSSGDQSVERTRYPDPAAFGEALAGEVVKVWAGLEPKDPAGAALAVREERFQFASRIDLNAAFVRAAFSKAFFPELVANYIDEYQDGVRPRLTVAMLDDIAFVAVSGEFFANHSVRLKQRARVKHLFFCGYANGYHQYFPTIEAIAEGGYGADALVSPAEPGAGELIMNKALLWLYQLRGKIRN